MRRWEAGDADPSSQHLREMMLEMIDVVVHEVAERHGAIGGDGTEGAQMQVVGVTHAVAIGRGRRRHQPREVPVVRHPEQHELRPRGVLIALCGHPGVLLVALDDEVVAIAHPDEALVVVARRVHQVADDLARRPLAGRGTSRRRGVVEGEQRRCGAMNGVDEPTCEGWSIAVERSGGECGEREFTRGGHAVKVPWRARRRYAEGGVARASLPASLPTTAALHASSAPKSSVTTSSAVTGTRITPAIEAASVENRPPSMSTTISALHPTMAASAMSHAAPRRRRSRTPA